MEAFLLDLVHLSEAAKTLLGGTCAAVLVILALVMLVLRLCLSMVKSTLLDGGSREDSMVLDHSN